MIKVSENLSFLDVDFSKKKVLLQVSGGLDSTAMLHVLKELYPKETEFHVASIDFGLRDEASKKDLLFVQRESEKLGVLFHSLSVKPDQINSAQADCRKIRQSFVHQLHEEFSFHYHSIAHHRDDFLETFFQKLSMGQGLLGISGLHPKKGRLIRPFFNVPKEALKNYLLEKNVSWREDASNNEVKYFRNQWRNLVFPKIDSIQPSWRKNTLRSLEILHECRDWLQELVSNGEYFTLYQQMAFFKEAYYGLSEQRQMMLIDMLLKKWSPDKRVSKRNLQSITKAIRQKSRGVFWKTNNHFLSLEDGILGLNATVKINPFKLLVNQTMAVGHIEYHFCKTKEASLNEKNSFYFSHVQDLKEVWLRPRVAGDKLGEMKLKKRLTATKWPNFIKRTGLGLEVEGKLLSFFLPCTRALSWVSQQKQGLRRDNLLFSKKEQHLQSKSTTLYTLKWRVL